ncbi:hypothetical protein, partial [Streptomyces sp. E5N91]|uniref:hypothetical protein n=1 Tax=Streptomyces sp. E5N91 TaxID=1851996 RepID=UPI001EE9868B
MFTPSLVSRELLGVLYGTRSGFQRCSQVITDGSADTDRLVAAWAERNAVAADTVDRNRSARETGYGVRGTG